MKRFVVALEELARRRSEQYEEILAALRSVMSGIPEGLRSAHENIGVAAVLTIEQVRRRMALLEVSTIYEGMPASRAHEIVMKMGTQPTWRIARRDGVVRLTNLADCEFTADQLEALALHLRTLQLSTVADDFDSDGGVSSTGQSPGL